MKLKTLLLGLILSLFSTTIFAGGNHDHGIKHPPVNQEVANTYALKVIDSLISRNRIDKSWEAISISATEKKTFDGRQEWVVSFVNENIADEDKKKLYVFLTLSGEYLAVNYTGK